MRKLNKSRGKEIAQCYTAQLKVGELRSEHKQPDVRDYDQLTLHLGSKESGIRVPQK